MHWVCQKWKSNSIFLTFFCFIGLFIFFFLWTHKHCSSNGPIIEHKKGNPVCVCVCVIERRSKRTISMWTHENDQTCWQWTYVEENLSKNCLNSDHHSTVTKLCSILFYALSLASKLVPFLSCKLIHFVDNNIITMIIIPKSLVEKKTKILWALQICYLLYKYNFQFLIYVFRISSLAFVNYCCWLTYSWKAVHRMRGAWRYHY